MRDAGNERERLLADPRLRVKRITPLWPEEIRRPFVDGWGVLVTYVVNCIVLGFFVTQLWGQVDDSLGRWLLSILPVSVILSNVRLLVEELFRQWRAR
jgi:hypothetical protein